jgi:transposase
MRAEAGGAKGYDAGKKTKGRKRHIAVDTLGLPIKCRVTTADVQDRDALPDLLKAVSAKSPWVKLAFVDGGYAGDETQRAAYQASRIRITVVKRTDRQVKGFVVLPKRWIVERTFGWTTVPAASQRTSRPWSPRHRLGSCSRWHSCSSAGSPGITKLPHNSESGS